VKVPDAWSPLFPDTGFFSACSGGGFASAALVPAAGGGGLSMLDPPPPIIPPDKRDPGTVDIRQDGDHDGAGHGRNRSGGGHRRACARACNSPPRPGQRAGPGTDEQSVAHAAPPDPAAGRIYPSPWRQQPCLFPPAISKSDRPARFSGSAQINQKSPAAPRAVAAHPLSC